MSNTIFSGVSQLPTRFINTQMIPWQGSEIYAGEYQYQLFQEIKQRHEDEILARPFAYNWGFTAVDDENTIRIFVSKLPNQLSPSDLEQLQKPVGGLKVVLEFSDGEFVGHAQSQKSNE